MADGGKSKKLLVLYWALAALPLIVVCIAYPLLPDTIAVHFNLEGQANRWGEKWETLVLPILILALSALMLFAIRKSNKRLDDSDTIIKAAVIVLLIAFLVVSVSTICLISYNISEFDLSFFGIDMARMMTLFGGIVLTVAGALTWMLGKRPTFKSHMPKVLDKEDWRKLQRFGGKLAMLFGMMLVGAFVLGVEGLQSTILALAIGVILSAIIFVYGLWLAVERQ